MRQRWEGRVPTPGNARTAGCRERTTEQSPPRWNRPAAPRLRRLDPGPTGELAASWDSHALPLPAGTRLLGRRFLSCGGAPSVPRDPPPRCLGPSAPRHAHAALAPGGPWLLEHPAGLCPQGGPSGGGDHRQRLSSKAAPASRAWSGVCRRPRVTVPRTLPSVLFPTATRESSAGQKPSLRDERNADSLRPGRFVVLDGIGGREGCRQRWANKNKTRLWPPLSGNWSGCRRAHGGTGGPGAERRAGGRPAGRRGGQRSRQRPRRAKAPGQREGVR